MNLCHHQLAGRFDLGKSEVCGLGGQPDLAYAAELARRGFVTVALDAIGFEEPQLVAGHERHLVRAVVASAGWADTAGRLPAGHRKRSCSAPILASQAVPTGPYRSPAFCTEPTTAPTAPTSSPPRAGAIFGAIEVARPRGRAQPDRFTMSE